ncbi:hypothetical protein DYB32_008202 [Aphanomyces invadans]|uniref:TMEM131 second Ig-like domain-containing protein n=1 Tax=Aphanomyces invadans TaxID=157072 RepID=A0A418ALU2_9STRA|nr:hypothetical protein DYB32_008202 [Aphanomyces invadans]
MCCFLGEEVHCSTNVAMRSWSTGRRPTAACCIVVLCLCCVIAVAAEATPPGQSVPRVDGIATTVQHLRATLRAFEAMQAIPKPLPQSHHVEMWLGGVQYKSRMSPPWTDAATGRRVRFATGFGRRDVIVPVASSRSRGASATSWRARPFREYGFGDSQVVRVTPSGLDFGVQETCTPTLLSVQVSYRADALDAEHGHDASPSHDVQPLDIHGIAIHDKQFLLADVFHAVTLQPGDVHTFYVLFLPHEHSATIESTLTFQTSLGDVPYAVRGSGVPNRYRASKLAASIAAGVRYDPVVHLYNPHHQPLRVTEVFTTEGFLHLELPKTPPTSSTHPDDTRPTTGVWEIEAGATKPVMQLSFVSSVPGHYRAYVRVEMDKGHLILPVELTVLSEGLHLGATHLNFGVLVHDDEEHHIAVDFVNTGRTTVLVKGVSLQTPDSRISVVIQGSHAVGPLSRVKHAMVVSYGSIDPGTFTGMLIVHTNDTTVDPSTHGRGHGGDIWLNYTATKVSGRGLAFAPHEVEFTSCGGAGRGLVLTNYFDTAVAIEMVQLADPSLFSLHNFTGNAVAEAGTSWPPIYLDCIMDVDGNGTTTSPTLQWPVTTHTHSHLLVQTNVSRHRLQRFAELETQGDTVAEMQVVMYTDLVAVAPVVVRMPMARPRLVGESTTHAGMVEMPLTHVGNVSEMWLTVTNPSNVTIDVALALLASKDSDEIGASGGFYTCPSPTKVVAACKDTWKAAVASGDDAVAMPAFFLSSMDKQTLAPGDTTTLGPILFAPSAAKEYVGRLYLRNTLSHIEPVVVRGQGGRGHVRVVNNAVLDSHAPPRVIALENDGNMPLVVHGWSCPNCGKCSGHDAGFCVQFPGSSTSDAVPVELAPGGSRLSLNVSFVSGCRFNREVEVVVLHTSSGNVSVPLEGAVASPYRECLGTTRMSYLHAGGRVIVWGLFALIVSQIVHYTVEIVWLDCHASPADTNFGYTPPVATEAPAFPDHVDDDALDDELQAIEAQVFESFTFAPIRSPAVQRVHDQRKAALAQKPTDKKKAKLKKALAATTRPDAVRTAHATRTCSPRNDVATVAAPVAPDESPSKNGPTASPRKERCNAEDAQLTPVSPHRAPPHTTRGAEHEQTTLSSTPSTTADGSDLQHDRGTAMKLKNALSSLPPAIATTTHVEHHPAELAHAVRASAHLPPARGASRQVPPVAQEFPQGVVHGPGSASHAACATYLVDQAKADHNEAADDAEDNGTSSVVTAACATVNDVAKICAAGNDTSTKCEERVVESDDGVRYTAGDNGSDTETGAVDGDCSAESKSSDEDGTDNGADDTDDGIHATDASKLDAEDAVDDGSGSDDPTWSADLDRVPLHVDSTSRDNTIVLDEIDQLMQEVHNEQQFRWHEPSLLSPGRGNATHWHDELPPHSALRHDQFAMPRRPHTSFPPRSIKSPVAAPPGFSAADADPLAVSRTYAHLGQLRRPPHDNVPPPMWDSQAFKAPLVLFGSSYFTGHQAGRIGSRRPCRSNPPAERPSQRHDFEPFHRNAFPGRERSLASLVDVDAPFESSRDVFLKSEMSPLQRDSRFGFW